MYKKTLIAVALLSASSAAFSATWQNDNVTEVKHTDEGIEGMAVGVGVVTVPALIKLGAEYQVNDEITFTYNQAKAANSPFPSSLYSNKYSGTQIAANAFFMKADAAAGLTSFVLQQTGDAAGSDLTPIGTMITFEGQTTTHYISALSKSTNDITVTISPGLSGIVTAGKDVLIHTSSKFTMNLLSATSTSATYRVAATPNGSNATTTIGTLINTPSVNVTPAGLIAGDATVSFSAKTAGGSAMDALATAVTIAKALPTFTQTITKYDGIIDVEQGRLAFKGGNASSSSDVLTIGTVTQAGVAGNGVAMSNQNVPDVTTAATAVSTTQVSTLHTVDGDWNWMDTSASTAGVQTTGLTGSISPVLNAAGTAVTITATGDVPATTTLTVAKTTATKAVVIPVQGFSGKTVYNYTSGTAKSKTVTHSNLGDRKSVV